MGDEVFVGGICYGMVKLGHIYNTTPYKVALVHGRNSAFFAPLTHIYPTRDEYEASGVHWNGPPKLRHR